MATALKLGPADHGRRLTLEEYLSSEYQEGYHYEYIRGRLEVTPLPRFSAMDLEEWMRDLLKAYATQHPEVINFVSKARVFVTGSDEITAPEPDIAAYHDLPPRSRRRGIDWQQVSPVLVVEVLSPDDPDKDLVRNPALYLTVPSIREYWVLDTRPDPYEPSMVVHRRHGRGWRVIHVPHRGTYTTRLLPGFELVLDPFPEEE